MSSRSVRPWDTLPVTHLQEVDRLCQEFEEAWKQGPAPALAAYLQRSPEGAYAPLLAELLALDLEYRRKLGECPTEADYAHLCPDDPTLIRRHWPEVDAGGGSVATQPDHPSGTPLRLPDVPSYEILEELGRGGMGVVYKARQVRLNRVVALKMILAGAHAGAETALRFRAEAETIAKLQHPNIVQVYHVAEHDGHPFFEMEYLGGGSLAGRLDGTPRPPRDAAGLVETLAGAMAEAHRRGIVHRDLKPGNILLTPEGLPKVGDFGLAKLMDGESGMTRTDSILGSPSYMAPEQAEGKARAVGPAADLYALGAILYELLTGRPPFRGATVLDTLQQVQTAEPVPPSRLVPGLPRDLETIALKCLEKEADRRYPSAEALAGDLGRWLRGEPIAARPVGSLERLGKWVRRKPALAGLSAIAALSLLILSGGGPWVAWQQSVLARNERRAKDEAFASEKRAEAARTAESRARRRADITLADMYASRGLLADEHGETAEAVLWFAEAAEQAASVDVNRQADNHLRARNWASRSIVPVGVLSFDRMPQATEFQPGGELLLVRSDRNLVVWDWRANKGLPWPGAEPSVLAACWGPDGASLALGTSTGEVQVRRVPEGTILRRWTHPGPVTALAFGAGGRYLAVAGTVVRVWDDRAGQLLPPTWVHPKTVRGLAFSPKADRLATACDDGKGRVFAVPGAPDRPEPLFAPVVHEPTEGSPPAFIDNGRAVVTVTKQRTKGETGGQLTCWDAATGAPTPKGSLGTFAWSLLRVAASRDGRWLATGGYSASEVWDAKAVGERHLTLMHRNLVNDFAFSRDGSTLLSVSLDQTARFWSLPGGQPIGRPLGHMGAVARCALADDGIHFATAQVDGLVRVWRRPVDDVVVAKVAVWGNRARLGPDGRLATPGFWHQEPSKILTILQTRLGVVETRSGKPAGPPALLPGPLIDSCIASDSRTAAALSLDGATGWLSRVEIATGRPLGPPRKLPGLPRCIAARPGPSQQVAALSSTGDLLVVDARTGAPAFERRLEGWIDQEVRAIRDPSGYNVVMPHQWTRLEYTPDGAGLIVLMPGLESVIQVLDAATGRPRYPPIRPVLAGGPCRSLAVSADGRLLATAVNGKNAAQVWDLATGQALSEPLPHPGDYYGLFDVCFSPDGTRLLTGCKDGQVRYWDWKGAALACPPLQCADEVYGVAITPDGRFGLAAVRGQPQALRLWELKTGKPVARSPLLADIFGSNVANIAVSPDGKRALACLTTGDELAVIDLDKLLSPPDLPVQDLALLGELATGQQIELGDVSNLTKEQWLDRWRWFLGRNPRSVSGASAVDRQLVQARELDRLTDALTANPMSLERLEARGVWYTRRGRWDEASKDFLAMIELRPKNRYPWMRCATAQILAGDEDAYRDLRRRMIDLFRGTGQVDEAETTCKVTLLQPGEVDVSSLPLAVVAEALDRGKAPDTFRPWGYATRALAAYRGGDDEQAVRWSHASQESITDGPCGALSLLVLAMAEHRLHRADAARRSLAKAAALIPEPLRTLGDGGHQADRPVAVGAVYFDWLIAEILRREAAVLID